MCTFHLASAGYYMYIETSFPRSKGDKAILMSPSYSLSNRLSCSVLFWYHMYGGTIGTLNVYVKSSPGSQVRAWSKSGNQGNAWKWAGVNVTPYVSSSATSFQVRLSAHDLLVACTVNQHLVETRAKKKNVTKGEKIE